MERKERSKTHGRDKKQRVNDNRSGTVDSKTARDKTKTSSNGEQRSSKSKSSQESVDKEKQDKEKRREERSSRRSKGDVKDKPPKSNGRDSTKETKDRKDDKKERSSESKTDRSKHNPKEGSRSRSKGDVVLSSNGRDKEKHRSSRNRLKDSSKESIVETSNDNSEKLKVEKSTKDIGRPQNKDDHDEKVRAREESMMKAIASQQGDDDEEDYNYDDEDFEDYDDDFESEDDDDGTVGSSTDSEISISNGSTNETVKDHVISETERLQIKEAMALENSRVGSNSPSFLPSSPANTPVPSSPTPESKDQIKSINKFKRGLDFASAQRTQAVSKALSKSAQRGNDLLNLIELDTIYFDMFESKPQTEYELYMKSFGRSETYQKYTQYNEDSIDKEVMTEPGDAKTCWTQHPIEASLASAHEGEEVEECSKLGRYNPVTLNRFVTISTQIVSTLLEERASRHGYTHTFKPTKTSKLSNSSAVFPTNHVISTRAPIFSTPISAQSFAVCYTRAKTDNIIPNAGLTCTWNLQNIYEPVHVLVSNAAHRCACISSYNHNIIFVGCEDGSISLWDLNEPDNMHKRVHLNNQHFTVRLPTYNTCGIQIAECHNSKITSLQAIKFDQEKLQMASFQIASLDEHGVVIIWVVVSVTDASFSGSQTDLGLRPGSKIKLVKSAAINVNFPSDMKDLFPELRTFAFQQSYSDSNTYFVTTDKGAVLKASRNQSVAEPVYFSEGAAAPASVGSIDFNKFNWKYFIVGSSDGSIALYYVNRNSPLVVWDRSTRGRPVRSVQWSRYSSTIFYTMDSANKFYMWDLSVRDSTPLVIETYEEQGLLSFTELLPSACITSPVIVLTFKDGSIEASHVKEEAMNSSVDNITKLEKYLSSVG